MISAELNNLWTFLVPGYLSTIAIETPVLLLGLSRPHSLKDRLIAGAWLSACTYPIVVLVLPMFLDTATRRALYLAVAETFAPAAECTLFWAAFVRGSKMSRANFVRDMIVVIAANLASFLLGELWWNAQR